MMISDNGQTGEFILNRSSDISEFNIFMYGGVVGGDLYFADLNGNNICRFVE
jgi:hypothetical protein